MKYKKETCDVCKKPKTSYYMKMAEAFVCEDCFFKILKKWIAAVTAAGLIFLIVSIL